MKKITLPGFANSKNFTLNNNLKYITKLTIKKSKNLEKWLFNLLIMFFKNFYFEIITSKKFQEGILYKF